jgi:hypothetical protein
MATSPTVTRNILNVDVVRRHGKSCLNGWIRIASLCTASTAGKYSSFGVKANLRI